MRLERLHLLRYGALEQRQLHFNPAARLHLVYGPNEAGKSSALAAIADLLFGYPPAKPVGFPTDPTTWRVGATLSHSNGERLSFRRRRGKKNMLLSDDEGEAALRDDALQPFTGALSREVFQRAFGLDSARLRAGAHEMLRSDGELGSMLFAAASGLTGLSNLRAELNNNADSIFSTRASKDRIFYQVRSRHEDARKLERETELKQGELQGILGQIEEAETGLAQLRERRLALRKRLQHLTRLRQLHPIKREIDAERQGLADLDDVAALPPGLADELGERLAARRAAAQQHQTLDEQLAAIDADLARIVVDADALEEADAIVALFALSGDYTSKQTDLPRIAGELADYEAQLGHLARRLGLPDAAAIEARQPADTALQLVRDLASHGRSLAGKLETLRQRVAEEGSALAELSAGRPDLPLVDPKPLRAALAALAPDLKALDRVEELDLRATDLARATREAGNRLDPPVGDADRLATLPLPGAETVLQHGQALDAAADAIRAGRERLRLSQAEIERNQALLAEVDPRHDLPSAEAIAAARAERDAAFARLRPALLGEAPPRAAEDVALYGQKVETADARADAAFADVERVSRHAALQRQIAALERQHADLLVEQRRLEAEADAAEAQYLALWESSAIAPRRPRDMSAWLAAVTALLADRQALVAIEDEIAQLGRRETELAAPLRALAQDSGFDGTMRLPTAAMVRAIETRLDALADAWAEGRSLDDRRQDARRRADVLGRSLADAEAQYAAWQARFAQALPAIGLAADATIAQADAALAAWSTVPALLHERDNRARRVAGMRRDTAQFERAVGDLAGRVAPDLAGLPGDLAIARLRERAEAARAAHRRRGDLLAERDEAQRRLAAAQATQAAAEAALQQSCRALPEGADLDLTIGRLRLRAAIAERLAACRARFLLAADGHDPEALEAELAGFDRDQAALDIEQLEVEDGALVEQLNSLTARHHEVGKQREALDHLPGAELAAFQKHAAEAEIVAVSRQWAVLTLASTLLGAAMERQRAAHADPLMGRAGVIFSTLTGGAFAGLAQDFDDDDQPRLLAIRRGGERLGLEGLSEGTCDQLYLALRLAYLEDYATRNEPAPFIGDDLFQTFDDTRTGAGLRTLAGLGAGLQPILFTHHRSVVDIAARELGADLDLIEL